MIMGLLKSQDRQEYPVGRSIRLDLAVAVGDSTTADQHYRAALTIRERLAAADPGNAEYQRDLSVSHERMTSLRKQDFSG